MKIPNISRMITVLAAGCLASATLVCAQQSGFRFEFGRTGEEINSAAEGQDAKNNAQDIFVVTAEQINTVPEDMGNGTIVKIKAKIDSIIRSTQQRDIGDVIVIRYKTSVGTPHEKSGDPVIPEQGSKYKVYLKYTGAGRYYRLAASGYSFMQMNTGSADIQHDYNTDRSKSQDSAPYADPYAAKTGDQSDRTRLQKLRQGDAMPHAVDPYQAKPSEETRPENMDPYEPIGL